MDKDKIKKSVLLPDNLKLRLLNINNGNIYIEEKLKLFFERYGHIDEKIQETIEENIGNIVINYIKNIEEKSILQDIDELESLSQQLDKL